LHKYLFETKVGDLHEFLVYLFTFTANLKVMNKDAFFKLSYGLYILSSHDGGHFNGHISNTVFQVTADHPRLAVAAHRDNLTTEFILRSKVFSVSVLEQDVDLEFLGPWGFKSGREINKFEKAKYKIGKSGAPIVLDKTIAWYECEIEQYFEVGTHIIFIGKVIDFDMVHADKKPLTYAYYRDVIKGISPEHSPTYLGKPEELKNAADSVAFVPGGKNMQKYRCTICGFVYDPLEGDPPAGIPPGTAFEDIPDNWTCPVCGVTKADFVPLD